jgi:cyclophilin family peptidyl-prolyl cis-trans isomerase/HEAT repeat protein
VEELIAAEDARDLERLTAHARSPLAEVRARAVRALGRAQSAEAIAPLRRALADESEPVAREAAFALGLLSDAATPEVEEALVGKLAAADGRDMRAALCQALGRVGGERSIPAIVRSLEDSEETVRVAAAEAFGRYGMRQKQVGAQAVLALSSHLKNDGAPAVRAAASFAFTRIQKIEGEASTAARRALEGALGDDSAEVRMLAARALANHEPLERVDPLSRVTAEDPDWRVRVNSLKSLVKRSGNRASDVLGEAMSREARAYASDRAGWGGTRVHVIAMALELAADLPPGVALRRALEEALTSASPADPPAEARRALDQLHCLASFALDRMDGRPSRTTRCGAQTPEWKRTSLAAAVIGKGKGPAKARTRSLREMLAKGDSHSRPAILDALGQIDDDDARAALLQALDGSDLAEVATAADAIGKQAAKFLKLDPGAAEEASRLGGSADRRPEPLKIVDPQVAARLAKALRRMSGADDVEAALSIVGAIEALGSRDGANVLGEMLSHPNAELRTKSVAAMKKLGAALPDPLPRPVAVPNPIDARDAARLSRLHPTATLRTSRGDVVVDLLPDEAPGTVQNFIRLAKAGRYRGIVFHRVVPNFVVQGGDPRGDGYGGPGYGIRCEYNPLRYERAVVGMALAGKDTGGSQFFFTHSPQPHLDGRYTIFGRVRDGMGVVDVLQIGDTITDVVVSGD